MAAGSPTADCREADAVPNAMLLPGAGGCDRGRLIELSMVFYNACLPSIRFRPTGLGRHFRVWLGLGYIGGVGGPAAGVVLFVQADPVPLRPPTK